MTKQEFKKRWESNDNGGGISFDDIAKCAIDWNVSKMPRTKDMDTIRYLVLRAANTNDYGDYKVN